MSNVRLHKAMIGTVCVAAAAMTVLAACGSGGGASSATSGSAAPGGASASGSAGNVTGATSDLAKFTKTAPLAAMDSFNAGKLAGKRLEVIDCAPGAAPPVQITQGAAEAGKAAGLNVRVTTASQTNDVTQDVQLLNQAVSRKPDAIITSCVSSFLTAPVAAAKKAGIPVVATADMEPDASKPGQGAGPNAFGVAGQSQTKSGYLLGEWIAAHGPTKAKIGIITTNDILSSSSIVNGYKSAIAKYCSACATVYPNVSAADWTSQLTSATTALLAANPDLNYVIPALDGQTPYVVPGLRASQKLGKVDVLTTQGTVGAALGYVKSGDFSLDVGISENEVGWQAVDQAMRGMLRLSPEPQPALQPVLVSTDSLKGTDSSEQAAVYGTAYEGAFKKIWGLQ